MPPKKTTTNTTNEATEGKFTWEGPNEHKLLLLILGRQVSTSEYDTIAQVFPGATPGAIRNRISVVRLKQKKLYEELGWELPGAGAAAANGAAARKKGKSAGMKRGADADGGEDEGVSRKKGRVSRKKVGSLTPEVDGRADGEERDGVKAEPEEEEEI